jgi:MFS family permease
MRSIHFYLLGAGSWFFAFGIQGVMFAWLVAMELRVSAEWVGIAQMTLLLPGTLLILVGGSYADRFGGRRLTVLAQGLAAVGPLMLVVLLLLDRLSYAGMLGYAVLMGCATAFVTPARDGLLNEVAEGRVQRAVMLVSLVQFGGQLLGFSLAATTDWIGPIPVLVLQSTLLVLGLLAFLAIPVGARRGPANPPRLVVSLMEGARTVFSSPSMRVIVLQNVAMALFFMGSFVVTLPLLVRDVFAGSSRDLALMNGVNSLGLLSAIVLLLRLGDVQRPGRTLISAQIVGSLALGTVGLVAAFMDAVAIMLFWGMCGGIAMAISRTIMQEQAPADQRSRVMSFHAFSFMGAGPVGALLCGFLVELFGPRQSLMICAAAMIAVMLGLTVFSRLWGLHSHQLQVE